MSELRATPPEVPASGPAHATHAAPAIDFNEAVRRALLDWNFRRRASRSEFWWLVLAGVPATALVSAIVRINFIGFVAVLANIFLWLVYFKAMVRRYHDIGRTFWGALVNYVVGLACTIAVMVGLIAVFLSALGSGLNGHGRVAVEVAKIGFVVGVMNGTWTLVSLCRSGEIAENKWG